ncbi:MULTISPECIES: hypothetical protein [Caballeronia]|jgi:hypothetical protein|uniref:Uncharacterized protein n=1 Tax=Caballeronia zhejiangensis TaxID=871203 RepID=A0A656Q8H2_9BURK|nr:MULTISPECIES: hypothetical protein [Caballeronia]EKS66967.1 hypothetical protein BURK_034014 [Burkholderia sp. SJ98]KDR24711.1 hypothetical protein BG60_35655 [Caballeronia zhejiangensis]MCG7405093.1 hypothetical protein [Caballeronia zhejiangensis]MDR5768356.1 hypothetical protein [Caballeronia sp. LZ028]MDR5789753.1 hypothetical protein [Caballeronia sp. LP003]
MSRRDTGFTEEPKPGARRARRAARAALACCCAMLACVPGTPRAQRAEWLDARVTQATIVDTICIPGYVDRVLPSFEIQMRQKERLLKQRSIDPSFASEYALDHRMPVLLGGSPNSPANLDLRRWEGREGQRRKERLAVYLKRCVCTGDMTLKEAQTAMAGDWPNRYPNLSSMTCTGL